MKKIFFFFTMIAISFNTIAQGNSNGKAKGKSNAKSSKAVINSNTAVNTSTNPNVNASQKGYAKNQPKKVQSAFLRDYPGATNVSWDKYKGDYTATFNNGIWRSTAVYHANGDRRDTRTPLTRNQLPGTIWDRIFKRDNVTPTQYVQIERPSTLQKIFRVLSSNNTAYYYDQNGNKVSYNY